MTNIIALAQARSRSGSFEAAKVPEPGLQPANAPGDSPQRVFEQRYAELRIDMTESGERGAFHAQRGAALARADLKQRFVAWQQRRPTDGVAGLQRLHEDRAEPARYLNRSP